MTDNFLNNDNYYNKGGLNGKPKEPRPEPPKKQSSDNKDELVFNQLIHEKNELRKYIINICELLDINTNQSVLGANCLEFYAVLCSTAENKIKDLQQQLKRNERECEDLNSDNRYFVNQIISLETLTDEYEQALDEIENIADDYNRVEKTSQYYRDGFDQIQDIIDSIKGNTDD